MATTLITGAHFAAPPTTLPDEYECVPYRRGYIVGLPIGEVYAGNAIPVRGHFVAGIALALDVDVSEVKHWAVACEN